LQFRFLNPKELAFLRKPVNMTDVVAAHDGSLASLLRVLPRYFIMLGRAAKRRKWVTATVRLMRHLFAIIGARARARSRKRSARACKRAQFRAVRARRHRRKARDFEGFWSFRRGFNERAIESSSSSRSPPVFPSWPRLINVDR